jgi:sec-independent protein translocase protein TatC
MAPASKDLFDDSTMSFGEHLEVLRTHLWKALIGVCLGVVVALFQGSTIIAIVRQPVDKALRDYGQPVADDTEALENVDLWQRLKRYLKDQFSLDALMGDSRAEEETEAAGTQTGGKAVSGKRADETIRVSVDAGELGAALHRLNPDVYPPAPPDAEGVALTFNFSAPEFRQFRHAAERANQVVALNVQEPFMTYLKVSMVSGLVLASPWVFYQLWLFVAAGLFPHERKFVYLYGTASAVLFIAGGLFCFYLVFPFVLRFLLGFNEMLKIQPQIRLSEWISFAVTLPLVFGVSFQLPLVMLLLERLGIFSVNDFREKRRLAILVIAIISMLLTPADPISMLMMMAPLVLLYELGIGLCRLSPPKSPFESELTTA